MKEKILEFCKSLGLDTVGFVKCRRFSELEEVYNIRKDKGFENEFEEQDIERFVEKLERLYPDIQYVNHLMTHSCGEKVVRFYDLDGNLIEVGTPM